MKIIHESSKIFKTNNSIAVKVTLVHERLKNFICELLVSQELPEVVFVDVPFVCFIKPLKCHLQIHFTEHYFSIQIRGNKFGKINFSSFAFADVIKEAAGLLFGSFSAQLFPKPQRDILLTYAPVFVLINLTKHSVNILGALRLQQLCYDIVVRDPPQVWLRL